MLVSILHRATGSGIATLGTALLVWWLAALAAGEDAYATFRDVFTYADGRLNAIGWAIGVGLTLSLFQHLANGVRHLFMDIGAGFALKTTKAASIATIVAALVLTAAYWLFVLFGKAA